MIFCVLSDSHGSTATIDKLLLQLSESTDKIQCFLHAGDFAADAEYLRLQTGLPVYNVYGNSDYHKYRQLYKPDEFIEIDQQLIWLTHGHKYLNSSEELDMLCEQAKVFGANIVVYGHTHTPDVRVVDNIVFLNPGSVYLPRSSRPSYAILQADGLNIKINIHEIY